MKPTVLIATHKRIQITEFNIETLMQQTVVPKVVLVVSDMDEYHLFKNNYPDVFVCRHPNQPLGGKWNYGVQIARTLGADPLVILGSDDILGENYIENCTKLTTDGNHFIGLQRWFIHHKGKAYLCDYLANLPLGGGRCHSAAMLDKLDWKIFEIQKNRHLDDYGFDRVRGSELKMKWVRDVEKEGLLIHAIKGPWDVMNAFNLKHKNIKLISTHDSKRILPLVPGRFHDFTDRGQDANYDKAK